MSEEENSEKEDKSILQLVLEDHTRLAKIREAADEVLQCDRESSALNARRAKARATVRELGVNGNAFNAAVSRLKLEATDRKERELSYQVCLAALGIQHDKEIAGQLEDVAAATPQLT